MMNKNAQSKVAKVRSASLHGFTLVEIMIVVAIIGLLAAIAMPAFAKARRSAGVGRCANDLRVIDAAFQQYALESGSFPPNVNQNGVLPAVLNDYLKDGLFNAESTPCGGRYRWINSDIGVFSYAYIISITDCGYMGGPKTDLVALQELDERIDDGDPTKGRVRLYGGLHYHYVVEFK